jgi:hypothetical protein
MRSFYDGLLGGDIYPRWERDVNRGFGAPTFSFYPPGVYYLTSVFFAFGCEPTIAILGAVLLMALGSALAFYVYASRAMNHRAAIAGMAAYVIWPYHLVDLYQRGAIAEMTAFVWMPLMMYFADRLIEIDESERRRHVDIRMMAGLAAAYSAFLWSHPPTAYQFTVVLTLYTATRCTLLRRLALIPRVVVGLLIGGALAAAYLLPAASDLRLVRGDFVQSEFPYHEGYVFGDPARYGESAAQFMREINLFWGFGAVVIILGAITLWLRGVKGKASSRSQSLIAGWIVSGVAASYLMTAYSRPLSEALPWIEVGVFPWRLLAVTTLIGALIVAALVHREPQSRAQRRRPFSVSALRLLRLRGGFHPGDRGDAETAEVTQRSLSEAPADSAAGFRVAQGLARLVAIAIVSAAFILALDVVLAYRGSPAFSPQNEHLNFAMLPRSAYGDLERLPKVERTLLAGGRGTVEVERWEPGNRTLRVRTLAPEKLLVRTFNFPGWTACVDGQEAEIIPGRLIDDAADQTQGPEGSGDSGPGNGLLQHRKSLGDIGILLSPGDHLVTLEYGGTNIQKLGTMVTMLSSLITLMMAVGPTWVSRRRNR